PSGQTGGPRPAATRIARGRHLYKFSTASARGLSPAHAAVQMRGKYSLQVMQSFPPVEIATKLLLSLGIGLLIGFEREWSHKDLGARTFTIVSLFGMLAALIAPVFMFIGLAGVIALVVVVNLRALNNQHALESTTS